MPFNSGVSSWGDTRSVGGAGLIREGGEIVQPNVEVRRLWRAKTVVRPQRCGCECSITRVKEKHEPENRGGESVLDVPGHPQ